jgi:hypothetical protein
MGAGQLSQKFSNLKIRQVFTAVDSTTFLPPPSSSFPELTSLERFSKSAHPQLAAESSSQRVMSRAQILKLFHLRYR